MDVVSEVTPAARFQDAEPVHVLDVRAGDEGSLCAREDDNAGREVRGKLLQAVTQKPRVLHVERVQRVRAVDRHDGRTADALDVDGH